MQLHQDFSKMVLKRLLFWKQKTELADVSTPLNLVSIILHYIFELRRIKFFTMRHLPDKYLVDLGAQHVFEETLDTSYRIEWPFSLMAKEYCDIPKSIIYDSSGTRLNDEMAESVENAFVHNAMLWHTFSGENKSVGAIMERV